MKLKKLNSRIFALTAGCLLSVQSFAANWNIAVGDGGGSAQEYLGTTFVQLLEEKSKGKHTAKLFLNGQLGSEQGTVNDAAMGLLDFSILASNNLAPFSPSVGILSLPYIFESLDEASKIVFGPFAQELKQNTIRDTGVRIIGWTFSGYRMLSNSKRPIKSIDQLQGLSVRVPKNEIMLATYKSWGINASPIAWTETFTALQQGVVDGQDSPYITMHSMKFGEIQKYVTEIHYLFLLEPLIVSEALFQDLSKKDQKIVESAGEEATKASLAWLQQKESVIKTEMTTKYNMQIDTLSDEDVWAKTARTQVWPSYYESVGGKDKINQILNLLGKETL